MRLPALLGGRNWVASALLGGRAASRRRRGGARGCADALWEMGVVDGSRVEVGGWDITVPRSSARAAQVSRGCRGAALGWGSEAGGRRRDARARAAAAGDGSVYLHSVQRVFVLGRANPL